MDINNQQQFIANPPVWASTARPALVITERARTLLNEKLTDPSKYKTRNSCFGGHPPSQSCYSCAEAELNTATTGHYDIVPSVDDLIEFATLNDIETAYVGNIHVATYLKDFASRRVHFFTDRESVIQTYIAFLNQHYKV